MAYLFFFFGFDFGGLDLGWAVCGPDDDDDDSRAHSVAKEDLILLLDFRASAMQPPAANEGTLPNADAHCTVKIEAKLAATNISCIVECWVLSEWKYALSGSTSFASSLGMSVAAET